MADPPVAALLDRDLSDPDLGQLKAGQLEIERKDARLTMRLPRPMLDAVKRRAKARGIPTSGWSARRSRRRWRPLVRVEGG